jgi:outer membrane protein OmpA-like peptidoglycan-associated protein
VAGILNKYPDTNIRVEGHTDKSGSVAYNLQLSERRASSVKNALIQQFIAAERIQSIGYGETMPIGSDAQNRRVSIVIIPAARG